MRTTKVEDDIRRASTLPSALYADPVQKGVRSRLYDRGRYSPKREQGVHHFHKLLTEWLDGVETTR